MKSNDGERLSVRVERGTKPRIKVKPGTGSAVVSIPLDTTVNWPSQKADLIGGFYVQLQKLQQQFKISLFHGYEKKPEVVVYCSSLSHDQDVKAQVRELNSTVPKLSIAGPNLEVSGSLKARNLTLESTVGTLRVYGTVATERLALHSQNVVVATEALISTPVIRIISRKVQLDGKIFPSDSEVVPRCLDVQIDSQLLHIGVDGCIGESNEKENTKVAKRTSANTIQIKADQLSFMLTGSLANYGNITASDRIDMFIGGSVVSLGDGALDSATRGYSALKQIRGIGSENKCTPSASTLYSAIADQKMSMITSLIEKGVDLNDKVNANKRQTLRQSAIMKYKQTRDETKLNSKRDKITLINALFTVHDWRRGHVTARQVQAKVDGNCDDCAQFTAKELQMKIGGNAVVENDSIWTSTWVEVDVGGKATINGQVKQHSLILNAAKEVTVSTEAILSHEIFTRINCQRFMCDGIWSVGENFVVDAKESVHFGSNSYIESEKFEVVCGHGCACEGTWQLAVCYIAAAANVVVSSNGKIFVEDSATIGASGFLCHGFVNVTELCDMQLKDSAHFFHGAKLECQTLKLFCECHCTIGGLLIIENMNVYVRHDLITTSTGKCAVFKIAEIKAGSFKNDSTWQIEDDCSLTCGSMDQSEDGVIFVKQTLSMAIYSDSEEWSGKIIASYLALRCLKFARFEGFLKCNECEVTLPYLNESRLTLAGQVDVLAGPLTVKGNADFSEHLPTEKHSFPALVIEGKLNAQALVAPFHSLEVAPHALVRLMSISSRHPDPTYSILVSAGALTTGKGSCILSTSSDVGCEGIVCASTFYHEGQVRFNAQEVFLLCNSIVHYGRLTNTEGKQNHMKKCTIVVEEILLNQGIIACDVLEMEGEGSLDNRNRIFAVDSMNIRLSNFNNDEGLLESKNSMKLLSVSKEWTKVGGSIKSKKAFDLCANKLDFAVKDVQHLANDKRISFSAKTDLLISTNIQDELREMVVGCAAQQSVSINSVLELDRLEILLGGDCADTVVLKLTDCADVYVNTLIVTGGAKKLKVVVDGSLKCRRLRVASSFLTVLVTGRGAVEATNLIVEGLSVAFDICHNVCCNELNAKSVQIRPDSLIRLQAVEGDTTTINCESLSIDGTVFVEQKLFIGSKLHDNVDLNIKGPLIGASSTSEVSVECSRLTLSGQVANLKFFELDAKESITLNDAKLKNISAVAIECVELHVSATIDSCSNVVAHSDVASFSGSVTSASADAVFSVFSTSLHSTMSFANIDKVNLGCRRSAVIRGSFEKVNSVQLDAKWLTAAANVTDCGNVQLSAWSINSGMSCSNNENVKLTALGVIMNNGTLAADVLVLVAPFVISLSEKSNIASPVLQIHALTVCTRDEALTNVGGVVYLWLAFMESLARPMISQQQANSWRETATMMKDRFNSPSIDVDEIILGIKYLSDLTPTKIDVGTACPMYEDLMQICRKFEKSPINTLSTAELVCIFHSGQKQFSVSNSQEQRERKTKKKAVSCLLYDGLVQFKSARYGRESRGSSDTDIGYVSRSSSEDLDGSKDRVRNPSTGSMDGPNTSMFCEGHLDAIEEKLENVSFVESTAEEVNVSLLEEEELAEFESLEQEIMDGEEGIIRTDYIVCRDERIHLARFKEKSKSWQSPRPKAHFPLMRAPSSNDLVMKRFKLRETLSTLDLRSMGSESSLASLDMSCATAELGSPMHFPASPFQRSRIPRGSFRSPQKIIE